MAPIYELSASEYLRFLTAIRNILPSKKKKAHLLFKGIARRYTSTSQNSRPSFFPFLVQVHKIEMPLYHRTEPPSSLSSLILQLNHTRYSPFHLHGLSLGPALHGRSMNAAAAEKWVSLVILPLHDEPFLTANLFEEFHHILVRND